MKPVLVLQHQSADGPAYLARWLAARGLPFEVVDDEARGIAPATLRGHSALAILGGEMSANDPLPALRHAEALFLEAVRDGVPTIGHCLGAQLMARALGARVTPSPAPEIGWQPLQVLETPDGADWLGVPGPLTVFQWHHEAFELPPGALPLAASAACPHQAFSLGPHLAMQFHVEIDADKLHRWSLDSDPRWDEALRLHPGSVQDGAAMRAGAALHLVSQQALADRCYARWIAGCGTA